MTLSASWFWPDVGSRRNALSAIEEAFWVAVVASAFTLAFALINSARADESAVDYSGLVDSAFFAGAAVGFRQKSRVCALVVFVPYVGSRAYLWISSGHGNLIVVPLVSLALLHGVRGTFAHHRFSPLPAGIPSMEDSFRAVAADSQALREKSQKE
jgi:hypothetical protein